MQQEKIPAEETGELLDDHLGLLVQNDGGATASSWKKGHSPRFEGYSWEDARWAWKQRFTSFDFVCQYLKN